MDFLKELFKQAEDGKLSYEDLEKAVKSAGYKVADLSKGDYVARKKYDDDLASRDTRITELNDTLTTRDADLKDIQAKLDQAGTDATKLTELNTKLADLQSQYDADMQAYNDKLNTQAYEFAVKEFANSKQFTSNAAKRDFISSMIARGLQMEKDTILGAEDFVKVYTEENADAFVVEDDPQDEPPKDVKKPRFAGPTNPGTPDNDDSDNMFKFHFTGVR